MDRYMNDKNIFADKATFILRKMLAEPDKKWVTRDFIGEQGVSLGMAQGVLETMEKRGYIERIRRGPNSYVCLADIQQLINDWIKEYNFEFNKVETFYSHDKNILFKLKDYLKDKEYAFTLHSGANLITSFVLTDEVYFYLKTKNWEKDVIDLRQQLDLKELVRGGNVHIIRPYYKKSIFYGSFDIKGAKLVSNLQLYLDLYNFKPRGREHAEFLRKVLDDRGINLYEYRKN